MPLIAKVNIKQFIDNILAIKKRTRAKIIAVVKADAYGHGAAVLAKHSEPYVAEFAVADFKEAQELVDCGIKKQINILSPLAPFVNFNIAKNIVPTVCSLYDIEVINNLNSFTKVNVELNTGMNRLGLDKKELACAIKKITAAGIKINSVFSHLFNATDKTITNNQLKKFNCFTKRIPKNFDLHLAASSCMHLDKNYFFDAVRPGIGLYGYADNTKPILKICAGILKIFNVKKGDHISYGDYIAPRDMRIASIRAGYADGIKRKINPESENRFMSVRGTLCPIIGQVCMDITMIDVTHADVNMLDRAYILGNGVTADMLACELDTNVYEVLTNFRGRVVREYVI